MTRSVRLTQIDGKLPNLALMALAYHHRARGDAVHFYRTPFRQLGEPDYDRVYGSAIFSFSGKHTERLRTEWPDAIIGGTGSGNNQTVEALIGDAGGLDYSFYPEFSGSIGFTQRGCRLSCKFCVVPAKEGKPRAVATIHDIWRGDPWPKHIHLLDNDFFGQPETEWRARIEEIREGGFKVCFNQGLNVRAITDDAAAALATIQFRDDQFKRRRLYTAWDNLKDEEVFFRGVDTLERHGIKPSCIMAYMLVGYDKKETWERIFHRFDRMVARKIKPYPMVYGDRLRCLPLGGYDTRAATKTLADFQRWVLPGIYRTGIPFWAYDVSARSGGGSSGAPLFEAVP